MRARISKAKPKSRRVSTQSTQLRRGAKSVARKAGAKAMAKGRGTRASKSSTTSAMSDKRRARPLSLSSAAGHPRRTRKASKRTRQSKDMLGMIKTNIQKTALRLGDNVEKTGRKLRRQGRPRVGRVVERVGNRLEHVVGG